MSENTIKTILTAAISSALVYFGELALPLALLVAAMIFDYTTGMISAYVTSTLSSRYGITGILKKLCYMFAVACGIIIDTVCRSALCELGITGSIHIFGILVTVWLILNEIVSILENLAEIGVPLPKFLGTIAGRLKSQVEMSCEPNENTKHL